MVLPLLFWLWFSLRLLEMKYEKVTKTLKKGKERRADKRTPPRWERWLWTQVVRAFSANPACSATGRRHRLSPLPAVAAECPEKICGKLFWNECISQRGMLSHSVPEPTQLNGHLRLLVNSGKLNSIDRMFWGSILLSTYYLQGIYSYTGKNGAIWFTRCLKWRQNLCAGCIPTKAAIFSPNEIKACTLNSNPGKQFPLVQKCSSFP